MLLAYVTGRLTQEERAEFERRLLEDGEFSAAMEEAEFALLEDYASDSLPAMQRRLVEEWIAVSPTHRDHIAITKALRRPTPNNSARWAIAPTIWWAAAAACVALFAAVLLARHHSLATPPQEIATERRFPQADAPSAARPVFNGNSILLQAQRLRGTKHSAPTTYVLRPNLPTRMQILISESTQANEYSLDMQSTTDTHFTPLHFEGLHATKQASVSYVEIALPKTLRAGSYSGILHAPTGAYQLSFSVRADTPAP